MTTIDELTQKALHAAHYVQHDMAPMRAAVLAVLAEVRATVPEEMPAAHGSLVSFAVVQAHNAFRAEMLRRLDAAGAPK